MSAEVSQAPFQIEDFSEPEKICRVAREGCTAGGRVLAAHLGRAGVKHELLVVSWAKIVRS